MAVRSLVVLALAAAALGEELVCDKDNEGSCAPSMLEVKQASVKKHATVDDMDDDGERAGADLATNIANWRTKFATATSYCYENSASPRDDCWANKPTTTEECSPRSGTTVCKCAAGEDDRGCNIGLTADEVTGRCADILVYIGGTQAERHGHDVGVSGTSREMFCQKMVLNDQWRSRGLLAATPETVAKQQLGWVYYCPWGYVSSWSLTSLFSDGECHRKKRYLGERCWQAWGDEGTCMGSDASFTEYSTSCFQDSCVPYTDVVGRYPCECSWAGANLFFVCSAKDNACNGHACSFNFGRGGTTRGAGHFCDFSTSQNWQTLISR